MAHFRHRTPSARTPFGHRNIMQTEINEPNEGEYLCIKKDGEDWPVVICDEEIIKTFFGHLLRPKGARRDDGSWDRDYKAGGILFSDRRYPAIILGTMEFTWASLKEIEPIDPDMGRAIQSSTTNRSLERAWSEYIDQYKGDKFGGWKDLDHWKTKLHAQRLERTPWGIKEKKPVGRKSPILKRKGTPTFKYPPGYYNEEVDDEEPEDLFLLKDNTVGPKIKREPNPYSSEEIDALYDDDADSPHLTSSQSSKRSKLDPSGRFSMRSSTSSGAGSGKYATPTASVSRGTPSQWADKKSNVNDPDTVIIYVDNPHKRFKVNRAGLDTSPLLSKLVTHHHENGWYIMSPMLSKIAANDFQPIGEYIDRREYHPNILDDGTVHVRLEGDLTPEMLRRQVVRCGTVYQVAGMLEMPSLQDLAFRKLKALTPHYEPLEILTVIESLFEIGGVEICRYLMECVADHYWDFVVEETAKMVKVMTENKEFARGVFRMLSGVKDEGVKMEVKGEEELVTDDQKIAKAEEMGEKGETGAKEGIFKQSTTEAQPDNVTTNATVPLANANANTDMDIDTAAAADHANNPNNEEGLTQAEKDMLRMALRRSHDDDDDDDDEGLLDDDNNEGELGYDKEERTGEEEEDWVRLVRKQEEIFEAF